jgi:polygalacturonase
MQECFFTLLMILSMFKLGLSSTTTFNVLQYGAVGDGKTNDSPVN